MVPVKNLMIGINCCFEVVVGESAMEIEKQWFEPYLRIDLCKNVSEPVDLRLAF